MSIHADFACVYLASSRTSESVRQRLDAFRLACSKVIPHGLYIPREAHEIATPHKVISRASSVFVRKRARSVLRAGPVLHASFVFCLKEREIR